MNRRVCLLGKPSTLPHKWCGNSLFNFWDRVTSAMVIRRKKCKNNFCTELHNLQLLSDTVLLYITYLFREKSEKPIFLPLTLNKIFSTSKIGEDFLCFICNNVFNACTNFQLYAN